jgi:uncharacterized membrane protein (Fun14 family)
MFKFQKMGNEAASFYLQNARIVNLFVIVTVICFCNLLSVDLSDAAKDFGDMADGIKDSATKIGSMLKVIGLVIGIGFTVGSLAVFATMKKTNTPAAIPMLMFVAGIALLSISALVDSGSQTIFGDNTSELGDLDK